MGLGLFWPIIIKTIQAYLYIAFGFIAGKYLKVDRLSLASTLFYIIAPIIFLTSIPNANLSAVALMLPIIIFSLCGLFCFSTLYVGKYIWKDNTTNIVAFSAGNTNAGFFGLSIAMIMFTEAQLGMYVTSLLGIVFFENTIGYYISSRGHHSSGKDAFHRILKLPILWGATIGLLLNMIGFKFPEYTHNFIQDVRGAYIVLGMMVIGLGLSGLKKIEFDPIFTLATIGTKYILWPATVLALILVEKHFIHFFEPTLQQILILVSLTPLATNTVTIATLLNIHPEKMSTSVVLSIIIAALYLPFMFTTLMKIIG